MLIRSLLDCQSKWFGIIPLHPPLQKGDFFSSPF